MNLRDSHLRNVPEPSIVEGGSGVARSYRAEGRPATSDASKPTRMSCSPFAWFLRARRWYEFTRPCRRRLFDSRSRYPASVCGLHREPAAAARGRTATRRYRQLVVGPEHRDRGLVTRDLPHSRLRQRHDAELRGGTRPRGGPAAAGSIRGHGAGVTARRAGVRLRNSRAVARRTAHHPAHAGLGGTGARRDATAHGGHGAGRDERR